MIINLTQHTASPAPIFAGVVDLPPSARSLLEAWLTFDTCPGTADVAWRAEAIAALAAEAHPPLAWRAEAMIGGAPWLMSPLAEELRRLGIKPLFAFSRRQAVDQVQPDGSVRKTAVFRHGGWVHA